MPYRRRMVSRRRPMTRRNRLTRRRRIYRRRAMRSSVYHFKRTFIGGAITSATTTTLGAYSLQFSNLPQNTEFTSLFDMYRINKIVIKFIPNHNSSEMGATKYIPQFHTAIDYTDATAPANLEELYQYQSWRMTNGSKVHTRQWVPSVLIDALESTPTQATIPKLKQWISTEQTDVKFFGLKYGLGATNAAGDVSFTPYVTYYYSCKTVK